MKPELETVAKRFRNAYAGQAVPPLRDVLEPAYIKGAYAGVYSSFLRHAEKASANHGVDTRAILVELDRRKMVGGQNDMIVDVALDMAGSANG